MKELILAAVLLAELIFGYHVMKRLDDFLEDNQKRQQDEEE